MTDDQLVKDRLALLPPIRRARLWRLYAEDQATARPGRFLDFWMDDGRSILGAKGTGIGTAAKAAIDTGLTRPFPSVRKARLERTLLTLHPGFAAVRLYRNEERAIAAAALVSANACLEILRPFSKHLKAKSPIDAATPDPAMPRVAMPRLPCPGVLAPGVLLFTNAADAEAAGEDIVPPLSLACASRALSEFDRFAVTYNEGLWRKVDRRLKPFFERSGPFLYARAKGESYGDFFRAALGVGILFSPDPERPSIIPGDFDDGELAALTAAPVTAPGN